MEMRDDPTIARIRAARRRISEQCGHDPRRVIEYYMELQEKEYRDRLLVGESGEAQIGETVESRPFQLQMEVVGALATA